MLGYLACGLQEAGSMSARQTPNSCRNNNTSIMLSSNGTPIYVKTDIIAQNAAAAGNGLIDGSENTMWAVKVTRSSKEALLGERRMQLLVSSDGRILWASPASPAALFGLEPAVLVGQKLQGIIDLFAEYCSGEAAVLVDVRRARQMCVQGLDDATVVCAADSSTNMASTCHTVNIWATMLS
jgi:hypothetical protein